jgi:hypothetical protein
LPQNIFVRKNVFELGNVLDQLFILIEDLLTLKSRKATQLKIEDRLRLYLGKRQSATTLRRSLENASSALPPVIPFHFLTSQSVVRFAVSHALASSTERAFRISGMM